MAKKKAPAGKGGAKKAAPKKVAKPAVRAARIADVKHPTVEEQWADPGIVFAPPKRSLWARFRSAVTGLFVSRDYANANPATTVRERAK